MLSSQRELFDIPGDVCFLNAASYSPLPLATLDAGRKAVARKGRPWLIDHAFASKQYERARNAAARLINADPEDVALISSVGYGVAAAAKILPVPTRSRVMTFDAMYSSIGRPSIPPERLLKAQLLIALYSVRSERQFCERLDYDLLFRFFLDMNLDDRAGTRRRSRRIAIDWWSTRSRDSSSRRSSARRRRPGSCRPSISPSTAR